MALDAGAEHTTARDGGSADLAGANICPGCIYGGPRQQTPNLCLAPLPPSTVEKAIYNN